MYEELSCEQCRQSIRQISKLEAENEKLQAVVNAAKYVGVNAPSTLHGIVHLTSALEALKNDG